tara:strand:+ start:1648 stop:2292 length:645 start_codon:yes stop_codon:yes gene_type:complete
MIKFLKKYKIEFGIFLLLSILIPFFGYVNEDKKTYYHSKINLSQISSEFKPIFRNFLNKNSSMENRGGGVPCETIFEDENETHIRISVTIGKNIKNKLKVIEKIENKCKNIILKTFNQYIAFNKAVIEFFESNENDEHYKSYLIPKKADIYNNVFFLNFTMEKFDEDSIDFVKTYEPSSFKEHFISLMFSTMILISLFGGFVIAKKNLSGKKRE